MNNLMPDGTYQPCNTVYGIDPIRISERIFGGPHWAEFWQITETRIKDKRTGDVFDTRGIHDAWFDGRNLMPIVFGPGRSAIIQTTA